MSSLDRLFKPLVAVTCVCVLSCMGCGVVWHALAVFRIHAIIEQPETDPRFMSAEELQAYGEKLHKEAEQRQRSSDEEAAQTRGVTVQQIKAEHAAEHAADQKRLAAEIEGRRRNQEERFAEADRRDEWDAAQAAFYRRLSEGKVSPEESRTWSEKLQAEQKRRQAWSPNRHAP